MVYVELKNHSAVRWDVRMNVKAPRVYSDMSGHEDMQAYLEGHGFNDTNRAYILCVGQDALKKVSDDFYALTVPYDKAADHRGIILVSKDRVLQTHIVGKYSHTKLYDVDLGPGYGKYEVKYSNAEGHTETQWATASHIERYMNFSDYAYNLGEKAASERFPDKLLVGAYETGEVKRGPYLVHECNFEDPVLADNPILKYAYAYGDNRGRSVVATIPYQVSVADDIMEPYAEDVAKLVDRYFTENGWNYNKMKADIYRCHDNIAGDVGRAFDKMRETSNFNPTVKSATYEIFKEHFGTGQANAFCKKLADNVDSLDTQLHDLPSGMYALRSSIIESPVIAKTLAYPHSAIEYCEAKGLATDNMKSLKDAAKTFQDDASLNKTHARTIDAFAYSLCAIKGEPWVGNPNTEADGCELIRNYATLVSSGPISPFPAVADVPTATGDDAYMDLPF